MITFKLVVRTIGALPAMPSERDQAVIQTGTIDCMPIKKWKTSCTDALIEEEEANVG